MRTALLPLLLCLFAGAAQASAAAALCHEDERADEAAPVVAQERAQAQEQEQGAEEHILPCGFLESGLLGPSCPDAAFYVTTPGGTLLCRVLLPAVHLERRASTELEERPAASLSDRAPLSAPAPALLAGAKGLPRPLLEAASSPLERALRAPLPPFEEPPPVPS